MTPPARPVSRRVNVSVGAFVVIIGLMVLAAIVQSARLQNWFDPGEKLRVILPQQGLFGLSAGSEVQVIGTRAGVVREIIIDPETGNIFADVRIRPQFTTFIRTDSKVTIKRKLAVAGDAFLDISRGAGEPLDWDMAVIEATIDSGPTDMLNAVIAQVQEKAIPALDHMDEAVVAARDLLQSLNDPEGRFRSTVDRLASISTKIDEGQGTIGRLVNDDELIGKIEAIAAQLNQSLEDLRPVAERLQKISEDVAVVTGGLRDKADEYPQIVERTNQSLEQLQAVLADVKASTKQLPALLENLSETSDTLPGAAVQAQQTLREIERLAKQARQSWLLGGGPTPDAPRRLSPEEARP